MDNRLKEMLSAMLDDEADEFSIQRVMRQADPAQMQSQWHRWQQARSLMHDSERAYTQVDVADGVWQRLNGEATEPGSPVLSRTARNIRRSSPWAAAAMIVLGMGIGFGAGFQWKGGGTDEGHAGPAVASSAATHQSSSGTSATQAGNVPSVAISRLDQAQRNQLSEYLLRHAQHNSYGSGRSAVGFARVASISYQ